VSCKKTRGKWAKSGPNTRNWATRGHVTPPHPHPPPHPMGWLYHPKTHVGEPHLWFRTHQRAYRALEMGGQNGRPAENLKENGPNRGQIPEIGPHEATSLHLAPTPHPTPRGGSTTPRRTLGSRIYGLGPTNGPIGPWQWAAKMGVLQKISREMGQIGAKYPKLGHTRPRHSTSPPPPTPPHGMVSPPPDARWGAAFMG
jgi:hypothetical protein